MKSNYNYYKHKSGDLKVGKRSHFKSFWTFRGGWEGFHLVHTYAYFICGVTWQRDVTVTYAQKTSFFQSATLVTYTVCMEQKPQQPTRKGLPLLLGKGLSNFVNMHACCAPFTKWLTVNQITYVFNFPLPYEYCPFVKAVYVYYLQSENSYLPKGFLNMLQGIHIFIMSLH